MDVIIQIDGGGWHIEWYREAQTGPEVCRWYGTRAECEERVKGPAPCSGWVSLFSEAPSYGHAALGAS